jgi:1-acyl-sn-glycerol-3-phosphate acyltransferase
MLEANKSIWFEKIFAVYNRNLLNRRFNSLQVSGLKLLQNKKEKEPLIIYANHSSWWDGLVAFQISHHTGLDSYIMMEEKQLKKLPLFRKLGAFSIIRENGREALKSINYATQLLRQDTARTLWIFPQGEIMPNDFRPFRFYNGLARIILSLEKCSVCSLAIRYEFLSEYKPDIFVKIEKTEFPFENLLNTKPKEISEALAVRLTAGLNQLKSETTAKNFSAFEKIC